MPDHTLIKGYFWAPSQPEIKRYGEITISEDSSKFSLNLKGFLPPFQPILYNFNYHDKIPIINGFSNDKDWLTVGGLRIQNILGSIGHDLTSNQTTEVELNADYLVISSKQTTLSQLNSIKKLSFSPQFSNRYEVESTIECDFSSNNNEGTGFLTQEGEFFNYKLIPGKAIEIKFDAGKCTFKPDYYSLPFDPQDKLDITKEYDFIFEMNTTISLTEMGLFLIKMRRLFSLLVGTYVSLDNIKVWAENSFYKYYFQGNKSNVYYPSGIRMDNRIADLNTIVKLNTLNNFLSGYNNIQLPLSHYFDFIESGKDMPHQELLLLISALEVMFNRTYDVENSRLDDYPKIAKEILALDCLTKHQKNFLKTFKKGTRIKTFKIRDKILKLIEDSNTLVQLVREPNDFVSEILEVRHYIVHEANPSTLELYNNEIKLRQYNMRLKVILEYYLLLNIGFKQEYLDEKIHRTLTNMAQFR